MATNPHSAPKHTSHAPTLTAATPPRFIKLAEVRDLTSLSRTEIYRRIAAGTFPAQIALGRQSVAWIEAEVLAWCSERIAESRRPS